jgi:membrane fusion protein (multidrug efflux system)
VTSRPDRIAVARKADDAPSGAGAGKPAVKGDDIGFVLPPPAKISSSRLVAIGLVVVAILVGLFASTYLPRTRARVALVESTKAAREALPRVQIVSPKESSSSRGMKLPGTVKPLQETILYSRANGFVRDWKVDIGDKVKEGQTLAEIETPELDQEIVQARAQLAQASASVRQADANRAFAKSSLERYKKLSAEGLASQQDLDEKTSQSEVDTANVEVAEANVRTQQANLARLGKLKSFATVTAPFAGTITARMVERGALVVPGNSAPLFRLAAVDPVRVFIDVPQDVAPGVTAGLDVAVTVREYPGRVFKGIVSRTAGALDAATRTLSTEVRVPNGDGALLAGMFADAALTLLTPHHTYELPSTAILTGAKGVAVQVVLADDTVRLTPVVIEQDQGATVRIASGLRGDERILKLSSPGMADGTRVEIAQ